MTANKLASKVADEQAVRDFTKYKRFFISGFAVSSALYIALYILKWYSVVEYTYLGKILIAVAIFFGIFAYAMHISLGMIKNFIQIGEMEK